MTETISISAEKFVDINRIFSGRITFEDSVIADFEEETGSADYHFDKNYLVFPGFVDIHTHLRYGQPHKEDPRTGTEAAINGGVTRIADMPNNPVDIAPLTTETLEEKVEWAKQGLIPIHLLGAVKPGSEPIEGLDHYKVYLGKSVGDIWFRDGEQLRKTIHAYSGKKITFHCEDQHFLDANADEKQHHQRRPAIAERYALREVEKICEDYGIIGNIAHASILDSLKSDLYKEITPHHMLLGKSTSPFGQVNPPLRGNASNLRKHIRSATFIATDHAPHTIEEKKSDNPPSGLPMLDTYGNCVGYLIKEHGISPETITRMASSAPRSWLGLDGVLGIDNEASFTVINMKKDVNMSKLMLYSKADWTPFTRFKMPEVTATFTQGVPMKLEGVLV